MKHARTARPAPRGRCLVMAVAAIAALRCASTTTLADEPVATHSGKISAELLDASTGLEAFRGIPFAAPPTGVLRWRPPQDVAPWTGVRVCTAFGAVCPQRSGLTGLVGDALPPQNEDCLFLNVWTANARRDCR